jgi:hypothetical protein
VIYLDRILLEGEEVREERAPHVLYNLVVAPSTMVDDLRPPEHTLFDLLIHPGTTFTASHVIPPFDAISIFCPFRTLMTAGKY